MFEGYYLMGCDDAVQSGR